MADRITTHEALTQTRRLVDAIDHAGRRRATHDERLALVEQARLVARQVAALESILIAEADAASSSMVVKGTPTTSWLTLSGGTTAKEAAGLIFAGRDLIQEPAVQDAATSGRIGLRQARSVVRVLNELPDSLSAQQRVRAEAILLRVAPSRSADHVAAMTGEILDQVAPHAAPTAGDTAARLAVQAQRARRRRSLTFSSDKDGSILIKGSLPETDATPLVRLIDAYVEHDRRAARNTANHRTPAEALSPQQRRADALLAVLADHQTLRHVARRRRRAPGDHRSDASTESSRPAVHLSGEQRPRPGVSDPEDQRPVSDAAAEHRRFGVHHPGDQDPRPGGRASTESAHAADRDGPARRSGLDDRLRGANHDLDPLDTEVIDPRVGGDRPRLVVIMHEDQLRDRAEAAGILDTGTPIDPGTLRRLCCDADLTPVVLGTASEILDVGRTRRLVTDPIRRALALRDGGCVLPGCDVPAHRCEAHHLIPWQLGGPTSLGNLALVCVHHHPSVEPVPPGQNPPPDRWQLCMGPNGRPVVIPPARIDSRRTPIPCRQGPLPQRHPQPAQEMNGREAS